MPFKLKLMLIKDYIDLKAAFSSCLSQMIEIIDDRSNKISKLFTWGIPSLSASLSLSLVFFFIFM